MSDRSRFVFESKPTVVGLGYVGVPYDVAVILTDHPALPHEPIAASAGSVFETRGYRRLGLAADNVEAL